LILRDDGEPRVERRPYREKILISGGGCCRLLPYIRY
jgi:hypothetical protein